MKSGQWQDPKTGLIWMRCSIGQKWNGNTCTGKAIKLTWSDAREYTHKFINGKQRFGGYSNWRLPTIAELATIRYCSKGWWRNTKEVSELTENGRVTRRVDLGVEMSAARGATDKVAVPSLCADGSSKPAINTRIFPTTVADDDVAYWSSLPTEPRNGYVYCVAFGSGLVTYTVATDAWYVRLVRSGQ